MNKTFIATGLIAAALALPVFGAEDDEGDAARVAAPASGGVAGGLVSGGVVPGVAVGAPFDRAGPASLFAGVVNNAATTKPIKHKDMHLLDRAEFERVFAVNVIGNYQMCRAAEKPLKANGDGAIVNISSVGAFRAGGSSMAYCASKAAVNNLTISMARIMAPEVRVNALCPGGLFGPWTNKILDEKAYQARVQAAKDEYPLGKGLWPKDVAEAALWLIEGASTMTGEAIRMDSGQHLGR